MTFKHVKFEDSVTMRSLIKIAQEKGLIKEELGLTKTASTESKPDYTPSSHLMENIIKLCAGLRDSGLDKFANELESKFMDYKRATSLYETSKETGEDVVDQAHPNGSHKVSDVEGDATVETIIDQQLKMINVVNKKPTGKLANNLDILKAVKKVVAEKLSIPENLKRLKISAEAVNQAFRNADVLTRPTSFSTGELLNAAKELTPENISFSNLNQIYLLVIKVKKELSPSLLGLLGINEQTWVFIEPHLNVIQNAIYNIQEELKNPTKPEVKVDSNTQAINNEATNIKNTLNAWAVRIKTDPENSPEDIKEGLAWIENKMRSAENIKKSFSDLEPGAKEESFGLLMRNLESLKKDFPEFKQIWIG